MAAIQRRSTMRSLASEATPADALPETLPELPPPSPWAQERILQRKASHLARRATMKIKQQALATFHDPTGA